MMRMILQKMMGLSGGSLDGGSEARSRGVGIVGCAGLGGWLRRGEWRERGQRRR